MSDQAEQEKKYPDIWYFDQNRRIYPRDANGRPFGSPIWREHWVKLQIVGETSRSWVPRFGKKIPKSEAVRKENRMSQYAFSEEEIDRLAFIQNRHRIATKVSNCQDYETLRKVAELIGFKEEVL
jgi:hypothetical protein